MTVKTIPNGDDRRLKLQIHLIFIKTKSVILHVICSNKVKYVVSGISSIHGIPNTLLFKLFILWIIPILLRLGIQYTTISPRVCDYSGKVLDRRWKRLQKKITGDQYTSKGKEKTCKLYTGSNTIEISRDLEFLDRCSKKYW